MIYIALKSYKNQGVFVEDAYRRLSVSKAAVL